MTERLRRTIEGAYGAPGWTDDKAVRAAIEEVVQGLDVGALRVASPPEDPDGDWIVHAFVKQAILGWFRLAPLEVMEAGPFRWHDKIPLKDLTTTGARAVPPCAVRRGAFVEPGAILMPSYVNVGARVGAGTMVDTWATVGSCAQVGRNVHLSGGVGIGGVLEPLQARPTIIEDDCFIGARSEVVEGVIVERGAVLSMGVFIGASTRIYDRQTRETSYGRVPAGSVVVPGSLPAADGSHSLACAVIVKRVDAQTRARTSINELLRT